MAIVTTHSGDEIDLDRFSTVEVDYAPIIEPDPTQIDGQTFAPTYKGERYLVSLAYAGMELQRDNPESRVIYSQYGDRDQAVRVGTSIALEHRLRLDLSQSGDPLELTREASSVSQDIRALPFRATHGNGYVPDTSFYDADFIRLTTANLADMRGTDPTSLVDDANRRATAQALGLGPNDILIVVGDRKADSLCHNSLTVQGTDKPIHVYRAGGVDGTNLSPATDRRTAYEQIKKLNTPIARTAVDEFLRSASRGSTAEEFRTRLLTALPHAPDHRLGSEQASAAYHHANQQPPNLMVVSSQNAAGNAGTRFSAAAKEFAEHLRGRGMTRAAQFIDNVAAVASVYAAASSETETTRALPLAAAPNAITSTTAPSPFGDITVVQNSAGYAEFKVGDKIMFSSSNFPETVHRLADAYGKGWQVFRNKEGGKEEYSAAVPDGKGKYLVAVGKNLPELLDGKGRQVAVADSFENGGLAAREAIGGTIAVREKAQGHNLPGPVAGNLFFAETRGAQMAAQDAKNEKDQNKGKDMSVPGTGTQLVAELTSAAVTA